MAKIVDGEAFLAMPNGTVYRSVNLNTGKPCGKVEIKTGLRKDAFGDNVIGFYCKDKATGEESSACMPCPSACRYLIITEGDSRRWPLGENIVAQ